MLTIEVAPNICDGLKYLQKGIFLMQIKKQDDDKNICSKSRWSTASVLYISSHQVYCLHASILLRSAMAGCLYNVHAKHISNSGFDRTFMPSSGYILFSGVPNIMDGPTARSKLSVNMEWLPIARGKLVCEFNFHKQGVNLYKQVLAFQKANESKTSPRQNILDWQRVRANFTSVNVRM